MKRVLLLGAGGFLGRAIARELRGHRDVQLTLGPRRADLDLAAASGHDWDALLRGAPDVVINAAGTTAGDEDALYAGNTELVERLIDALGRQRQRPWLVHLGSAAEYGQTAPDTPVREDTPAWAQGPYGLSKLAATRRLLHAGERGKLRGVVLRVFNPVGAGQGPQTLPGRAALLLREAAAQNLPRVAFGALDTHRDYVALRDVARAVAFAAHLEHAPALLNVASGVARPSRQVVTGLARLAGYAGELIETASASPRSAGVPWQQADLGRMYALGWAPRFTLDDALRDLWFAQTPLGAAPGREEIRHDTIAS